MIEAIGLPIHDGPVGEERGVAFAARAQQFRFTAHIEIFLLTGEARLRKILGRGAAANGHRQIRRCATLGQFPVGRQNRRREVGGQFRVQDRLPDCSAALRERLAARVVGIEVIANPGLDGIRLQVRAIRRGRYRESGVPLSPSEPANRSCSPGSHSSHPLDPHRCISDRRTRESSPSRRLADSGSL